MRQRGDLHTTYRTSKEKNYGERKCLVCIANKSENRNLESDQSYLIPFGKASSLIALNLSRFENIASLETGTQLRWFGRGAAGLSVGINYSRYRSGAISGSEFGMNTTWTGIGVFGGGAGLMVSSLYWLVGDIFGGNERAERRFKFRQQQRIENPNAFHEWVKSATCFVSGTKILMLDQSEKNIENIKIGDDILGVNTTSFKIEKDRVINITKFKSKRIIKMILEDGKILEFTEDHPFWVVGKGWSVFNVKHAKTTLTFEVTKIMKKDYILVYDKGKLIPVKIIELYDTNEYKDVYNLDNVENNNTFFANKALVHNRAN